MNPIAIYSGTIVIYWSSIIIALGLLACLCMSLALNATNGERNSAMLLFVPLTVLLAVPMCRAVHWYAHIEQYASFGAAMTDYSNGSYVLSAALLAAFVAALIVKALGLCSSAAKLLDAFAPGAALAVAFIRLSSLFNNACRSKIIFQTPALQQLPMASGITTSTGAVEYRFATFFIHFILMLVICYMLLVFFGKRRNFPKRHGRTDGDTARMFLLLYSASEVVMDSTRYDSSFLHSNGFVSIVQIAAGVCILGLLVYYSIHSIKANGMRFYHWLGWLGFLATLGGVGASEYLVQRHGNWYMFCYPAMSLCCIGMAGVVYCLYKTCCVKVKKA